MNKLKQHVIIFSILVISLGTAVFLSELVFIRNTPVVRPNLDTYLAIRLASLRQNLISFFVSPKNTINVDNVPLKMVTKGVYAAKSAKGESYSLYKEGEVEWIEYTFNIKGKDIKIRVPKGQSPPPKESLELMQ